MIDVDQLDSFVAAFEDGSLPLEQFTHRGHLVTGLWYLSRHSLTEATDLVRTNIRRFNESHGGANTDDAGYHETLTRVFMHGLALHLAEHGGDLTAAITALDRSPLADRFYTLEFYSRERVMTVAARRGWVEPDLRPLDERSIGVEICPASPAERPNIRAVHLAAFPTAAEADIVDKLLDGGKEVISLVALRGARVVGHILFSSVTIEPDGHTNAHVTRLFGVGLAPLAVIPAYQHQGIGSRLAEAGLTACRKSGYSLAVVLGEPEFYRRFGFETASRYGLSNDYGVDEPFQVARLTPDTPITPGRVHYVDELR